MSNVPKTMLASEVLRTWKMHDAEYLNLHAQIQTYKTQSGYKPMDAFSRSANAGEEHDVLVADRNAVAKELEAMISNDASAIVNMPEFLVKNRGLIFKNHARIEAMRLDVDIAQASNLIASIRGVSRRSRAMNHSC